jgi:predicted Zn-dependent protease
VWLGALTLWLCCFALSAALRSAQASAALASKLDPLSDAGLRAEAAIAIHQGRLTRARILLLEAVRRNPSDSPPWYDLAQVDLALHDTGDATLAAQRVVALDPEGQTARAIVGSGLVSAMRLGSAPPTSTPHAGK